MTFAGNLLVLVSAFPLIWRTVHPLIPPQFIESYAYWDAAALNDAGPDGRVPHWRNMGYWTSPDESFTHANAALADKLLQFADAPTDGRTLDIGFGGGETLLLHLSQGADVTGLTTLPGDVAAARALVGAQYPAASVELYTGSATYTRGKDVGHPLNAERVGAGAGAGAAPFDLVYALDVAYHVPPTVYQFAADAHGALRTGGVLAYTDVLPPARLTRFPGRILGMWLALPLGVPHRNVIDRPASLDEYADQLREMGFEHVRVEDWSAHVWDGLADNLARRDGRAWPLVASAFRYAGRHGWRYIAVRAEKAAPKQIEAEHAQRDEEHEEHEDTESNEKENEL